MRIALFTTHFPVVSQTFVLNQVTGLIDRGHDVTVFARVPEGGMPEHADVTRYQLAERTHHWPERAGAVAAALSGSWLAAARAASQLSRIDKVPKWYLRPACAAVTQREAPFDAVLCHFGNQGLFAQWLRDVNALKGPLAVIFHGYDITSYVERNGPQVYNELFDRAELLLPISNNWERRLTELGAPADKIRVLRMGIDGSRFELEPRERAAGQPLRALTVARLVEKKGVEFALRAVARARDAGVAVEYQIVGEGPLRQRLEELTKELDLEKEVEFRGWCDQTEVVSLMRRAHVLLGPSVTSQTGDQEGIPVVLMEAMAAGLPVLSTRHSGIPELVPDEFLVGERDDEALAAKLGELAERERDWPRIGAQLRDKVLADFDLERLNDRLVELLDSMGAQS